MLKPRYTGIFVAKDQIFVASRLLLIKENLLYQVKEWSVFLPMGRSECLGLDLGSFDMNLCYLGPVSCVFLP